MFCKTILAIIKNMLIYDCFMCFECTPLLCTGLGYFVFRKSSNNAESRLCRSGGILSPGQLKDDVPASKDLPGKKSYLTTKAVERFVAELEAALSFDVGLVLLHNLLLGKMVWRTLQLCIIIFHIVCELQYHKYCDRLCLLRNPCC